MARLIFVNRYFHPDHSATSQMLSRLAFACAASGHEVSVITSRQLYGDANAQLPAREVIDRVTVHRVSTTRFGRSGLMLRAFDYVTFYCSALWCLLWLARTSDVVIIKTDPPLLSLVLGPVAWVRGAKVVNWLQDVFPEVAEHVLARPTARSRLLAAPLKQLRNFWLRRASVNVVLGDRMARHVADLGVDPLRIRIIANWADGASIRPIARDDNDLRRSWGYDGQFVVGYSGNLGRVHDFATFVDAAELLERDPGSVGPAGRPIRWLFTGGGALHDAFAGEVKLRNLSSVDMKPYQPQETLAASLSVADVHLVSLRPQFEGLVVPSKYYGIAAAGRMTIFIGDAKGEIAEALRRDGSGYCIAQGDGAALARLVARLAQDDTPVSELGSHARSAFEKRYAFEHAFVAWQTLFAELTVSIGDSRRSGRLMRKHTDVHGR